MSVQHLTKAANLAEQNARSLARSLITAGGPEATEMAQLSAEIATLIITHAERRASLMPVAEAERLVTAAHETIAEVEQQFDDGLIDRVEALARLDRAQALGVPLWAATHTRDVWETAQAELSRMGGEGGRGA